MRFKEILFTVFYTGYLPVAPGTFGTLAGMALYFLLYFMFGAYNWTLASAILVVLLYPAIMICGAGERFFAIKDPPQVVLDEVFGYWVSVLFYPFSWKIAFLAFVIFRIMDILKPYPVKNIQKLKGGLGIMIDDCIAGIYTNLTIMGIILLSRYLNMPIY